MKNKVNFVDDTIIAVEGIGDLSIERRDGRDYLIKDVLYIRGIMCNILIIVQLLEKGYKIHMENKMLRIMVQTKLWS